MGLEERDAIPKPGRSQGGEGQVHCLDCETGFTGVSTYSNLSIVHFKICAVYCMSIISQSNNKKESISNRNKNKTHT
jgi:hypothetical protein